MAKMNTNGKAIKIDGAKLREELRRRGLTYVSVSKELGFCDSYISTVVSTGSIGVPAAKLLNLRYNIDIELIKPDDVLIEEAQSKKEPEVDKSMEDLKSEILELTSTIKELKEDFNNYRVAMLQYMRKFENHKKFGHF